MDTERQIDIMGIVNLTDDSYFADSRCSSVDAALELAGRHINEGASILDIGACSSRPGSLPIGAEAEWLRLKPVLAALKREFPDMTISVDTYWSEVVLRVYDLIGNFIVNDISSGEDDPLMLETVGRLGLGYVAMHKRGDSRTMQSLTDYEDVTESVRNYFTDFAIKAQQAGIEDWILDPGFGFAKTIEQNYELLRNLSRLKHLPSAPSSPAPSNPAPAGPSAPATAVSSVSAPLSAHDAPLPARPSGPAPRRILVGISRKSFLYKPLGLTPAQALPATQAAHLAALQNGADILRVHDVAEAARTIHLYRLL